MKPLFFVLVICNIIMLSYLVFRNSSKPVETPPVTVAPKIATSEVPKPTEVPKISLKADLTQTPPAKSIQPTRQTVPLEFRTNQGKIVRFPDGEIAWADRVVSITPGNPAAKKSIDPTGTLGKPDYLGRDDAADEKRYLALGHGGHVVLEFTDNRLVDGPGADLAIFEIGPMVEPIVVAISEDAATWIDIGQVKGSDYTIDISSRVKPNQQFRYVRLTDAKAGMSNGLWAGADLDAVGAINTIEVKP
jgi:OmpA-OmpF porin, OOP family